MALLEVHNLYKTFRSQKKTAQAVQGVSLELEAGEVLAFLGPNGAGKTTTVKMIAGLIRPDSGSVRIEGLDPHTDPAALAGLGAVLEGNRNLYWRLSALENLEYFAALKGMSRREAHRRAHEFLERFALADHAHTVVGKFSRGMQQKLAIAMSLIHAPRLLLLDEPTLGLDVEAANVVKVLVREIAREQRAVLLTTHQLDVAQELSHRVAIIRNGEIIAQDDTDALLSRFSGGQYHIELAAEPRIEQLRSIQALGAEQLPDGTITFIGEPKALYTLLGQLAPLPIVRVEQDRADLTDIFLKLIRAPKEVGSV